MDFVLLTTRLPLVYCTSKTWQRWKLKGPLYERKYSCYTQNTSSQAWIFFLRIISIHYLTFWVRDAYGKVESWKLWYSFKELSPCSKIQGSNGVQSPRSFTVKMLSSRHLGLHSINDLKNYKVFYFIYHSYVISLDFISFDLGKNYQGLYDPIFFFLPLNGYSCQKVAKLG